MESTTIYKGGIAMVKRELEQEVIEVLGCIQGGQNFILEGGAGSGKTYSLISLLNELTIKNPQKSIVCITYTNNAVAEIKSRIDTEDVWVSTIHEFMWKMISRFQKELKEILRELINNEEKKFKKPKTHLDRKVEKEYFKNLIVEYDEYYSMKPNAFHKVKISHDHVLILAEKMFEKYTKLCDILKDVANYIFVDEYQDTDPLVAKILLEHLNKGKKKNVVGFFGDSMQAIYDTGVGNLKNYSLKTIYKTQNRRNPKVIIDIANKFREDDLYQKASDDVNAPNMKNGQLIQGKVAFVYGTKLDEIRDWKKLKIYSDWEITDKTQTRELRLTHQYNAEMAGFKNLYTLYNKDMINDRINLVIKNKSEDVEQKTFQELLEEVNELRKRKDVFEFLKQGNPYDEIYNEIKNYSWEKVRTYKIYKDSLFAYKLNVLSGYYEGDTDRDKILQRLDYLYELVELYETKQYNEFLKRTHFALNGVEDKRRLKEVIENIVVGENKTIEEILQVASEHGILKEDDEFNRFIEEEGYYLWERIKKISFGEYRKSIEYLKQFSPICTQHSVKGSEYDNVLVVLESNWSHYDFKTLFGKGSLSESVKKRTKNLFYVCITRAKKNLLIYMLLNDQDADEMEIIKKAKEYFGENNVYNIKDLTLQERNNEE